MTNKVLRPGSLRVFWRGPVFGDAPHAQQPTPARRRPHTEDARREPEPDLPHIGQSGQFRRHRAEPPRAVPGGPHQRRFRSLRGWRQAGAHFVYARARRPRLPDAGGGARRRFAKASSCRHRARSTTPRAASSSSSSTISTSSSATPIAFAGSSATWRKSSCTKAISSASSRRARRRLRSI